MQSTLQARLGLLRQHLPQEDGVIREPVHRLLKTASDDRRWTGMSRCMMQYDLGVELIGDLLAERAGRMRMYLSVQDLACLVETLLVGEDGR